MSANSTRPDTTTALLNDRQQGGANALDARPKTTTSALQTTSHVVGYMGDGINDALALPAADAGSAVIPRWTWPRSGFMRSWGMPSGHDGDGERSARRATTLAWQIQLPPTSARWLG